MTSENFDFADDDDVINMCQTLLQSSARRVSWISDMAAADHYQQSKVDSKLDDMEKVCNCQSCKVHMEKFSRKKIINKGHQIRDLMSSSSRHNSFL